MTTLTLATLLAQRNAVSRELEQINAALQMAQLTSGLKEGDTVGFTFGRATTKRYVQGRIIGMADTEKGKQLAVLVGHGYESEVIRIPASQVSEVVTTPVPSAIGAV